MSLFSYFDQLFSKGFKEEGFYSGGNASNGDSQGDRFYRDNFYYGSPTLKSDENFYKESNLYKDNKF